MKPITISTEVIEKINNHGEGTFPFECCGFLYGTETDKRIIKLSIPASNNIEGDQRRKFEISPLEYMNAEKFAINNNTTLLGIYHSHPNHQAVASEHDLEKAMPYFSYVIVSVINGKASAVKSWRLKDELKAFEEETVSEMQTVL